MLNLTHRKRNKYTECHTRKKKQTKKPQEKPKNGQPNVTIGNGTTLENINFVSIHRQNRLTRQIKLLNRI